MGEGREAVGDSCSLASGGFGKVNVRGKLCFTAGVERSGGGPTLTDRVPPKQDFARARDAFQSPQLGEREGKRLAGRGPTLVSRPTFAREIASGHELSKIAQRQSK